MPACKTSCLNLLKRTALFVSVSIYCAVSFSSSSSSAAIYWTMSNIIFFPIWYSLTGCSCWNKKKMHHLAIPSLSYLSLSFIVSHNLHSLFPHEGELKRADLQFWWVSDVPHAVNGRKKLCEIDWIIEENETKNEKGRAMCLISEINSHGKYDFRKQQQPFRHKAIERARTAE